MKVMTPTYLPFVSCLLFLTCFSGYAQSPLDSLLKLYDPQAADTSQARVINALVNSYMYSDKTKTRRLIQEGLELSNRLNFTRGKALFHYQWGVFYTDHIELDSSQYHYNRSLELAKEASYLSRQAAVYYGLAILAFNRGELEEAEKMVRENMALDIQLGDSMGMALSYGFIGNIHRNKGNFQIALQNVLKSLKIIESLDNPVREADALNILAAIEYNLGHYEQSIQYNKRAVNIYEAHHDLSYQAQAFNDIGNCYQRLESYDKAIEYYKKSMKKAEAAGVQSIYGSALSNVGEVRVLQGEVQEGLSQLKESLNIFKEIGLERKVAVTQNILGKIYNHLKQAEKAIPLLNASIIYSKKADSRSTLMQAYYYRSQAFELLGNDSRALEDFKLHKSISDSLLNREKIKQIEELRIIHDTEKKEDSLALNKIQIQALEQEVQLSQFRNSLYIGGIVSLLTIAGLLVFGLRQKIRKDQLTHEKQQALYQQKLAFKKKELMSQTLHLVQKNTFLQQIEEKMENLKQSPELASREYNRINTLLKIEKDTDKDWEVFKSYFADVHNNFDVKLKSAFPDVSESEIRLAALLKMNLSTKEIASLLHVLPDSVLKSKYRLKKKLGLGKESDLLEFLQSF